MKLADLDKVSKLQTERDYLHHLLRNARPGYNWKVGSHDLRPDLRDKLAPMLQDVVKNALSENMRALEALGVTLENRP